MSDWHEQELPELQAVKQWPAGFSWIAYPDERLVGQAMGFTQKRGFGSSIRLMPRDWTIK